eukprot:Em0005g439a
MEICASTEAEWESGNVDTGGSSTVTESHSPSAIASDELSLAIGDEDIGHLDEAEKDSESSSDSDVANILSLTNSSANKEGQYHPFLSMISAMAYIIIHSPRPMGLSNLTFVCHTLRCMFPALPSVSTMVSYRLPGYRAPEKFYSPSGVPFYVNSIAETIKLCLANPDIAKKMERYPVLPKKGFREIFHGLQWRNDTRFQAPMATSPVGSVFLKDIVQSSIAGAICVSIIKQFYRKEGHNGVFASVQVLQVHPSELNTYILSDIVEIPVSTIVTILPQMDSRTRHVYKKGHDGSLTIVSDNELAEMSSPHPLKTRSIMCGSLPVFMAPLIIFSDDTSGNRSKVWNKFDSWCFLLAGLRQKDNAQFCNIHFICTSNQVPVMEMAHPLVDQLLELERGIVVFDAQLNTNALILAPVICFLCDNPRAAEICSHLGSGTLRFCRICRVDHTNSLTGICEERKRSSTIQEVQLIRSAHTQAERKRLRTLYGTSEKENHLLQLPVDLHQSTPIESLHTLGLGPYKYLLREKMEQLSEKQRKEVVARIAALPSSGLTGGISSDISRHYKSFVGRDFKFLAQIAMFIFSPYLSEAEIEVWLALSMVFKMVYCDEFEPQKIELYRDVCHRFARAIDCYSVTWRKKLKIHLILHLPDSMLRFGPASSFNTERCESYNSVIRSRNVYSNRQAPSKDIATAFAIQESIRFTFSGSCYNTSERCGEDLVNLYHTKEVQAFLGGEVQERGSGIHKHGTLRKLEQKLHWLQYRLHWKGKRCH